MKGKRQIRPSRASVAPLAAAQRRWAACLRTPRVWVAPVQSILSSTRALGRRHRVLGAAVCTLGVSVALAMTAGQAWSASDVDYDKDGFTEAQGDCRPLDPAVGPAAVDRPESRAPFEDANCDGIDGDRERALFVSAAKGDDANPGTMERPVRTLAGASTRAQEATDGKDFYLAAGNYDGLSSLPAGVRGVFGDYLPDQSWARTDDPSAETNINRGFTGLDVDGSSTRLVLQRVTINAARSPVSRSVYGLRVFNGAQVALDNARVFTADGAAGVSAPVSAPRPIANPGSPGTAGNCLGSAGVGGAGGSGLATGGRGGNAGTIDGVTLVAASGARGSGTGAGTGGVGGQGARFRDATDGTSGTPGANGQGGANGRPQVNVIPTLPVTQWIGEDGKSGTAGAGGGGGGAGGSIAVTDGSVDPPQVFIETGGGGGGAGGAGGAAGGGGQAGGASIALFVTGGSSVLLTGGTIIRPGSGGTGGNGAAGQPGAFGGAGGAGAQGLESCDLYDAGAGGAGGNGGSGGPGGGGAGGPSFGVFAAGTTVQLSGVAGFPAGSGSPIQTGPSGGLGGFSGLGPRAGSGLSAQVFKNGAAVPVASADDQGVADFDDDGVVDRDDRCQLQPGSVLGCPARPAALPDADGDGVPDADDACPDNSSASALPCATPSPAPSPTPGPTPPEVDRLAPTLSALKVTPSRIRVRRGSVVGRARRLRLQYALSEAATVRLTLVRVRPGRREGNRCVVPRPGATGTRCQRLITVLARTRNGAPGVNTSRLRLARRLLRPGRYRVRARATDAAGNRGAMRSARLRIVKAANR